MNPGFPWDKSGSGRTVLLGADDEDPGATGRFPITKFTSGCIDPPEGYWVPKLSPKGTLLNGPPPAGVNVIRLPGGAGVVLYPDGTAYNFAADANGKWVGCYVPELPPSRPGEPAQPPTGPQPGDPFDPIEPPPSIQKGIDGLDGLDPVPDWPLPAPPADYDPFCDPEHFLYNKSVCEAKPIDPTPEAPTPEVPGPDPGLTIMLWAGLLWSYYQLWQYLNALPGLIGNCDTLTSSLLASLSKVITLLQSELSALQSLYSQVQNYLNSGYFGSCAGCNDDLTNLLNDIGEMIGQVQGAIQDAKSLQQDVSHYDCVGTFQDQVYIKPYGDAAKDWLNQLSKIGGTAKLGATAGSQLSNALNNIIKNCGCDTHVYKPVGGWVSEACAGIASLPSPPSWLIYACQSQQKPAPGNPKPGPFSPSSGCQADGSLWIQEAWLGQPVWVHVAADGTYDTYDLTGTLLAHAAIPGSRKNPCKQQVGVAQGPTPIGTLPGNYVIANREVFFGT